MSKLRTQRDRARGSSAALAVAAATAATGAALALLNSERSLAAERKFPPKGQLLDIDGVRLHVVQRGEGDPVLFLHGNGAMIEELEATGLLDATARSARAIAIDRPGFGHSTRPRKTLWTPERQAGLVASLLDRIGGQPAVVVGHSWGALLGAALAIAHPEKVRGLVLVSGFYFPAPRSDVLLGMNDLPLVGDILRHTVSPLIGWAAASAVIEQVFAPNAVTASFTRHYPVEMALRPSQIRALGEDTALMLPAAERLYSRYPQITCPTVILAGDADRIVDTRLQSERLARVVGSSELHVLDGVGHMLPHIEPMAVRAAIDRVATLSAQRAGTGRDSKVPAQQAAI